MEVISVVEPAPAATRVDLDALLAQARVQLASRPAVSKALALQVLKAAPGHPQAQLVLGSALRRLGDTPAARQVLDRLARDRPEWIAAHCELGLTLRALGVAEAARAAFGRATALTPSPDMAPAWRALGDAPMADAAEALSRRDVEGARSRLEARLRAQPDHVGALRLLAELETLQGRHGEAEALLARGLEIAPDAPGLRLSLAQTLIRQFKAAAALRHVETMLETDPSSFQLQVLKAAALAHLGECDAAIGLYQHLLAQRPAEAPLWLSYGDTLKTAGQRADCIAAYTRAVALRPTLGRAYWSLANLKTRRFTAAEVAAMTAALAQADAGGEDRLHLHYALGKALEDEGDFAASFGHYDAGAKLWRARAPYSARDTTVLMERCRRVFTAELFETRRGEGCPARDPIFIVGLPRSGSTLVEQILSSHTAVEATMELVELGQLAAALPADGGLAADGGAYPDAVEGVRGEALAALGRRYLDATAVHRKTDRARFIDKMPNNFLLIGLIHLILPNAKIIDVRRHPVATCFSAFKQHFPVGQRFSYDLEDVGRYYRDYVSLMAHVDAGLPGRVHRVRYEALVDDVEASVRALLDYCELPFEAGCLAFHTTARVVRTASADQVRRPIFREGVDQWRNFEPWLDPLKRGLGPALHAY